MRETYYKKLPLIRYNFNTNLVPQTNTIQKPQERDTLQLRDYQEEAVERVLNKIRNHQSGGVITIPTGGGKSIIIADIIRKVSAMYPDYKILMVTTRRELVSQNSEELSNNYNINPSIYSAGLNRKEVGKVTYASIASVYKMTEPKFDIILVDEAHQVPSDVKSMYRTLLSNQRQALVFGFTATPMRLGEGLIYGSSNFKNKNKQKFWKYPVYEKDVNEMIDSGYLSKLQNLRTKKLNLKNVRTTNGDYNNTDVHTEFVNQNMYKTAVAGMLKLTKGRKKVLIFCGSVNSAKYVEHLVKSSGESCEVVASGMTMEERDKIIKEFKRGAFKYLASVNVLTVGFNTKDIDAIVFLRPTKSLSLFLQMLGRGMRTADGKDNCLILDYVGNINRFENGGRYVPKIHKEFVVVRQLKDLVKSLVPKLKRK